MHGLLVVFMQVVMPAMMLAVMHRGLLVVVLVLICAHLLVVALLFVTLLRRCFLSKLYRGIGADRGAEVDGRAARHDRSRHEAEQPGPYQCS